MPSVEQAAAALAVSSLPLLLPDSCALLDVVRGPSRLSTAELRDALALLAEVTALPAACTLLLPSLVSREVTENLPMARASLSKFIAQTNRGAALLHDLVTLLSQVRDPIVPFSQTLPNELESRVNRGIQSASVLDREDRFDVLGMGRAVERRRPARQGKAKDAVIVEEALELSRMLLALGHQQPRVFLTSNTADFCERGVLHPDLDPDFGAARLLFATRWDHARHLLGL